MRKYIHILFCLGAFVPLTVEGNIMVDNMMASCYASLNHDLAHIGMTPIRWFPELIQWIFHGNDGLSAHVSVTKIISKWILPNEQLGQYTL